MTLSSKSQPSRNRLHEPFFSLSHSVVIDGLLRGLRMPGDGPCRGVSPWELSRDNHTTTSTTSCQLVLIKQNQCKIVWNKFFSFLFYVWNHPCSVQNWNLFHRQSSKELPSYFAGWPWKEPLLRNIWHKSQLGYFNCTGGGSIKQLGGRCPTLCETWNLLALKYPFLARFTKIKLNLVFPKFSHWINWPRFFTSGVGIFHENLETNPTTRFKNHATSTHPDDRL